MGGQVIRIAKSTSILGGAYLFLVFTINGIAGIVQPELGAGSGEGVLRTFSDDGEVYERRLAVVDDAGVLWLVSVQHFRRWYHRAVANPDVELVREGKVRPYRAVPVDTPAAQAHLTELLRSRAGSARFAVMRAVWLFASIKPLRLDPR